MPVRRPMLQQGPQLFLFGKEALPAGTGVVDGVP
jgi:hypothetical protein